ncbi:hypothetical protein ACH9EU_17165 [Kocuria sp. M1R5S2]|uniref:hypothetical protein n=1 Tax=Kocuria rhizosphaerae TaxID=3376285 RepID=UPI0037AA326B
MASTQSNDSDNAVGCVLLIGLGIVLAIIGFVIEHWEFFLTAALVVAGLVVVVGGLRALVRGTVGKRQARGAAVQEARRTGESDMRTAWMTLQFGPLPPQLHRADPDSIRERLAVVPKAPWTLEQLRSHGRAVWIVQDGARHTPLHREVEARLDRVAAMISDRTDEDFDTRLGQNSDQYLYHPDREVRAAYLEGGAKGVESIMDAVTAARAQAREDAAAKAAADAVAQQRNAALRALRETQRSTEARDAHAAWEARAKKIEE